MTTRLVPLEFTAAIRSWPIGARPPIVDAGTTTGMLTFNPYDPYALTMDVVDDDGITVVRWQFAREILRDGLLERAGLGDVIIWPDDLLTVCIRLSTPDGTCILRIESGPVAAWVARTYEMVPDGAQTMDHQVDQFIRRLLGRGVCGDAPADD